ncbi:MAG: polysaccharide deacetylase family protein [Propionibacteriaceae bacterium]|nr:polysaccharide deacetylase family protein [Propionibacteriaceae bacterium]
MAGLPDLTSELTGYAVNQIRTFRRTVDKSGGKGRYHAMSIDWQLLGRSPAVTGVEIWVTQQHARRVSIDRSTFWYDTGQRRLLGLSDLFAADAWPGVRRAMVHTLSAGGGPAGTAASLSSQGAAFGFTATGDLAVTLTGGGARPGSGPVSLRLSGPGLASRLSPGGLSVRASAHIAAGGGPASAPDCSRHRCLALTFDDGPSSFTPRLLGILQRHRVSATFFVVGDRVRQAPDLVAATKAAGMEIGNHSSHHDDLRFLSTAAMRRDLEDTSQDIARVTGHPPRLLRPPYGARNRTVDEVAMQLGMAVILWDVDTLDWRYPDASRLTKTVLVSARPGSIVLLHDAINRSTITALPGIIAQLQRRGFQLVTVSQLLGTTRAGHVYRRR